jgi:2-dehydropantoate 2-reductase
MPIKIAIIGLGGVGGYYGGLLSRFSEQHPEELQVYFIARGTHLEKIKESGLTVIAETDRFVTRPALVTNRLADIGEVDYLIMATKSYDLDEVAEQVRPVVGRSTIILPLLNGIDNVSRLRAHFPDNEVWYGCAYIIARLTAPGEVESSGNVHYLHFGHEKRSSSELKFIEKLFVQAGIEATLKEEVIRAIWRKFFYISTTAALTTYLNTGFRDLVWNEEFKPMYIQLMQELYAVSQAENIGLPESLIEDMMRYGGSLPAGTTSSMNSDYLAGRRIELETLVGVVVRLARHHQVAVPLYERIYERLVVNR